MNKVQKLWMLWCGVVGMLLILPYPTVAQTQETTFRSRFTGVTLPALFNKPKTDSKSAAILIIADSDTAEKKAAETLALNFQKRGYTVLRLVRFQQATPEQRTLDYLAAVDHLQRQPTIHPNQVGVIGYGKGAKYALHCANTQRGVAFCGILGGNYLLESDSENSDTAIFGETIQLALKRVKIPIGIVLGDTDSSGDNDQQRYYTKTLRGALSQAPTTSKEVEHLRDLNVWLFPKRAIGEQTFPTPLLNLMHNWIQEVLPAPSPLTEEVSPYQKPYTRFNEQRYHTVGSFKLRPWMLWMQPIAGQPRPYGYWLW